MLNTQLHSTDDPHFMELINEIEDALDLGVDPLLSRLGSSGVYFMRNKEEGIMAVFKPKDEEPYGNFNPRWLKWLQRICFPCCFGRGCLVINQGYLSEAGASLVDQKLGLCVVPTTKVMSLQSPVFNYGPIDRAKSKAKHDISVAAPKLGSKFRRMGLPAKIGSLQVFVSNFSEADAWLRKNSFTALSDYTKGSFRLAFEKLVVLDFLIRNTDRGGDNWLIKLVPTSRPNDFDVEISAIDNGLAFPFKHPDEWRAYPYAWASWPTAKIPFSDEIVDFLLPKLKSQALIEDLITQLRDLFAIERQFLMSFFNKQMGVFRGQVENLKRALSEKMTPLELISLPPFEVRLMDESDGHFDWLGGARKQFFMKKSPFFRTW